MTGKEREKYLVIELATHLPYRYSAGRYLSRFLRALRDEGRILASACAHCGNVMVPPRVVCGACLAKMEKFVEVGPRGTVVTFSVINFPFIDPMTGFNRPVPYGYGIVKLDGCDNWFPHFLEATDPDRLCIGSRVEAVFKPAPEREAMMTDILHFRLLEEKEE